MKNFSYITYLSPRDFRIRRQRCPLCNFSLLIRLKRKEHGIRCLKCRATPVHMSIASVFNKQYKKAAKLDVFEMSSRGALVKMFKFRRGVNLTTSEFIEDLNLGISYGGIRNENVESLTFSSDSFDLCTSTEVFEHVVNDSLGFREMVRVLRPGGRTIFTVPLSGSDKTIERASMVENAVIHHEPPEYHNDQLRGYKKVLAFRTYGNDIVEKLMDAGFTNAYLDDSYSSAFLGFGRSVVVAEK